MYTQVCPFQYNYVDLTPRLVRKESALVYADININNEFEIIDTVNMRPTRGQMISIVRKRKMSGDWE